MGKRSLARPRGPGMKVVAADIEIDEVNRVAASLEDTGGVEVVGDAIAALARDELLEDADDDGRLPPGSARGGLKPTLSRWKQGFEPPWGTKRLQGLFAALVRSPGSSGAILRALLGPITGQVSSDRNTEPVADFLDHGVINATRSWNGHSCWSCGVSTSPVTSGHPRLTAELSDGRTISVPLDWYPRLAVR